MAKNTVVHRILAFLKHRFTAWNTTGEGIHSPYLFYLVRYVFRDENTFYAFRGIERRRALLLSCEDELEVVDYGSAGSPEGKVIHRRVSEIARTHLEQPKIGQLLFRIVHFMGQNEKRPLEILELGTSLGITTAYLASPGSQNRVMTLEGSETVLKIAQGTWKALKLGNIEWAQGNIDDTLYIYAREKIDLAYVDANHTYEATKRYVSYLLPRMNEKGIIAIDDIHYSEEMEHAWTELKNDPRVTTTMDLYDIGLLFLDPHFLKRHYRIRV